MATDSAETATGADRRDFGPDSDSVSGPDSNPASGPESGPESGPDSRGNPRAGHGGVAPPWRRLAARDTPSLVPGLSAWPGIAPAAAIGAGLAVSAPLVAFFAWRGGGLPAVLAVLVLAVCAALLARRAAGGLDRMRARAARLALLVEKHEDTAWELRESEERYRSMAEAFGDLVMHRGVDGEILFANDGMARLFGRTPAAMLGTRFDPPVPGVGTAHPDGRAREVRFDTVRGERWFQWIDIPIRDGQTGISAIRSVARDITGHKRAAQALELARRKAESANSAKSRFLGMVSHEMRTPLNGILGMSRLIRETPLTPEQAAYNEAIQSSGSALLSLIEDLLDLTLVEAGRFDLKIAATDPRRLVEEVCELLAPRSRDKNIELASRIAPRVPVMVMVDSVRLRQVLVNLIGNAVKFTERGGVLIACEAETDGARAMLHFSITDTGPGMEARDARRIFLEFEQADDAMTRRHGGAGLGLSISRRIVERMGGSIAVESEPGRGSRFTFSIAAPVAIPAPPDADTAMAGRSVLVVSSGAVEAEAIAENIRLAGGRAGVAARLGEAADRLSGSGAAFDTVILDPCVSRDPIVSLKRLRRRAGRPFYAVVLVRPGERERRDRWLEGGFDGFLVRPVRHASLLRLLAERLHTPLEYRRAAGPAEPLLGAGESLPQLQVLLAEDNEINALLVRSILAKAGQCVVHVADGREAVAACRRRIAEGRHFDLILMDLHMPALDGVAAIRAIRRLEQRAGGPAAHILTLSADGQSDSLDASRRAGSDGFVSKPIDPADLIGRLRERASGGA